MQFKKYIPVVLKKPFWWMFKAPQHKAGAFTYWVEISGFFQLVSDKLFSSHPDLRPVTICITNKNRSEALLNYVAGSIQKTKHPELIHLSVFDCGSDDSTALHEKLNQMFGARLKFETQDIPFSRSIAMNRAVKNAATSLIFISDADISLPPDIVEKINFYGRGNRVWFPVCNALTNAEETSSQWYTSGKGITACTKQQFENLGGYDETVTGWGGEDDDLWFRFWKNRFFCYRTKEKNLIHHWHPSVEGAKKW